jgi:PAS domain S-box-containing protein
MQRLLGLFADSEDWLLDRVLSYASKYGYTKYTSTLREPWRLSIAGLTRSLTEGLKQCMSGWSEVPAEANCSMSPVTDFAVTEARRHRKRGVELNMFVGLLGLYGQTYRDLIIESGFDKPTENEFLQLSEGIFNHIESVIYAEWENETTSEAEIISELRSGIREMTNEKNKYLTAFESLPLPVILLDNENRVENLNHAAAVMFLEPGAPGAHYYGFLKGMQDGAVTGDSVLPAVDELFPWLRDDLSLFLASGVPRRGLEKIIEIKQSTRYLHLQFSSMLDISGKFSGTLVIIEDVTERRLIEHAGKEVKDQLEQRVRERTNDLVLINEQLSREIEARKNTEKALRERDRLFRAVFDHAFQFTGVLRSDGALLLANQAALDFAGVKANDVADKPFWETPWWTVSSEIRQHLRETVAKAAKGIPSRYETEHLRAGGEVAVVDFSIKPLINELGQIELLVAEGHDITERKRTEQALRETKETLQALIDASPVAVHVLDGDGNTLLWNPAAQRILGWSAEEVLGRFHRMTPEGQRDEYMEAVGKTIEGQGIRFLELVCGRKDGSLVDISLSTAPVCDSCGKITAAMSIFSDITEQKRAAEERRRLEESLKQARKMEAIGTLAGGIAHDFNNILGIILGFTQMVMLQLPNGSKMRNNLADVIKASLRAKDLIKQILTFSQRREQERKAIRIAPLVKETLRLLRASIPATIDVRHNVLSESSIMGAPTEIHQILMNLCTNAAHAMKDQGGALEVSLIDADIDSYFVALHPEIQPGPYVRLTVTDTGHGMSPALMERIFEPYFTSKGLGEGTGLGLAVVHGIVKSLQGMISVYSKPGEGTTFQVFIPRLEALQREDDVVPRTIPKGKESILFVDDEPDLVRIGITMLDYLGYSAVGKTNSIAAFEAFQEQPERFDLVITDLTMPSMTGIELASKILSIRPDIPVILSTGFSPVILLEEVKAMGIRELIMKPMVIHELAQAVRRTLDT